MDSLSKQTPSFKLGKDDGWLVEQRYLLDGKPVDDTNIKRNDFHLENSKPPLIINKQRRGW